MTPQTAAPAPDSEFQALVRAKYAGNPSAMTALGLRLVAGRDCPWSPVDGAVLIEEAARQGDPAAWSRLALLAAMGAGRDQSWVDAFDALARAVELGEPHAVRQASLLRELGVRGADDVKNWLSRGDPSVNTKVLHKAPRFVYPLWRSRARAVLVPRRMRRSEACPWAGV
jgi:TPR repeat protein